MNVINKKKRDVQNKNKQTNKHTHTHTHTHRDTLTHARARTCPHTHTHTHRTRPRPVQHTRTRTRTRRPTPTPTPKPTPTHTHTRAHTHTHTRTNARRRTPARPPARTPARPHARTHAERTRAHARARTCPHVPKQPARSRTLPHAPAHAHRHTHRYADLCTNRQQHLGHCQSRLSEIGPSLLSGARRGENSVEKPTNPERERERDSESCYSRPCHSRRLPRLQLIGRHLRKKRRASFSGLRLPMLNVLLTSEIGGRHGLCRQSLVLPVEPAKPVGGRFNQETIVC